MLVVNRIMTIEEKMTLYKTNDFCDRIRGCREIDFCFIHGLIYGLFESVCAYSCCNDRDRIRIMEKMI